MIPFKKIVFPVDYSENCRAAIPYVQGMTKHFSAQLTVVRAYTNPDRLQPVVEDEQRRLREFAAEVFSSQHVDCFLKEAQPADAIEKIAREQEADLIMLPTHGFDSLARLFSGSVTHKLLHDVSAVIWTSPGRVLEGHPGNIAYKSLLCAVDFAEETEAVLRAAAALASSYGAQLSLVHVVESSEPEMVPAADDRLAAWKHTLGMDVPHKILTGGTAEAVCSEAAQQKADLVVVGRGKSQGGLTRLLSDLYKIVRESPCPVLSV